ncbi:response regulator transcription factor [Paenibacillus qinlingensis]|uniref:Two-component system alkaline phosphatase synthesis response regulator PhoP n=1 Tax=Paenibacillus qinlingensis TaxID=1837343 RepID=A0ABU1NU99_9BACL|nr:response regulator transcription factor [Paenibacillus qinlingensis]MDR6551000.1 two-component system alkaline phosphatase synthesis response regulator PhoP [Paenibacillus qinlingensis]
MSDKIMVIEDEKKIAEAIAYALKREGYLVEIIHRGDTALERLPIFKPDALILDVMLPGIDGYEILKKLGDRGRSIGVIMLTAKEDIVHKVLGLELGADDYMTKPFDMRELLARLRSLLRRMQAAGEKQEATEISLGEIVLQLNKRTAYVGTRELELTPKEYDLLTLLLSNPAQVFTREQLLDRVWGLAYFGGTRTVDIHVVRLRKKLGEECGRTIQTVHGVGYKTLGGYREN